MSEYREDSPICLYCNWISNLKNLVTSNGSWKRAKQDPNGIKIAIFFKMHGDYAHFARTLRFFWRIQSCKYRVRYLNLFLKHKFTVFCNTLR